MKRLIIVVEGDTEKEFVDKAFNDSLASITSLLAIVALGGFILIQNIFIR